jgi:hypothetical protein
VTKEPRKRRSHVLEYLQKQAEERKAAEEEAAGQEGGDQPFPDFASELGLDKPQTEGEQ